MTKDDLRWRFKLEVLTLRSGETATLVHYITCHDRDRDPFTLRSFVGTRLQTLHP